MNNSRNTSSQEDFEAEQEAPPMEPPNLREGFQPPGAPGQPNAPGMPPRTPQQIIQQTYRTTEVFICAALIYLFLNFVIVRLLGFLETPGGTRSP